MFNLLQDGGVDQHEQISAKDKDIKPITDALCKLATTDLYDIAHDIAGVAKFYDDEDVEKITESFETFREDKWLDDIFGDRSRIPSKEFITKVEKDTPYIFNPEEVRKLLLGLAEVNVKHND